MLGSDYPFPLGEVPSIAPVTEENLQAWPPGQLIQDASMLTFGQKKRGRERGREDKDKEEKGGLRTNRPSLRAYN